MLSKKTLPVCSSCPVGAWEEAAAQGRASQARAKGGAGGKEPELQGIESKPPRIEGLGAPMFLDPILASPELLALPGVRCLGVCFSSAPAQSCLCPRAPCLALWPRPFPSGPSSPSSSSLSCRWPVSGRFGGEGGWEQSIQAICFKAISGKPWGLCGHIFSVFFQRNGRASLSLRLLASKPDPQSRDRQSWWAGAL